MTVRQVFYTSPWIPAEWIKAHGLEPRGVWSAQNLRLDSLPASAGACAFAEAVINLAETQADSAVIFTTTCDQLRRGFDAAAQTAQARTFLFNIPATWQSPAALRMYRDEVERLGRFLEGLGGQAPSTQTLRREMLQRSQARRQLLEAAPFFLARQFAGVVARFHWDGSVNLPPHSPHPPATGVPLAIVGGPLPAAQWSLLEVIEAAGGRVALDATETGERSLCPAFGAECSTENPLDLLTRGYFDNIVDAFQRPNTRLYSWLKPRLLARKARGIVLWHFTGCDLWRAEMQTLREAFGLPVLLLEAGGAQAASPRDAGRIQAFIETLK